MDNQLKRINELDKIMRNNLKEKTEKKLEIDKMKSRLAELEGKYQKLEIDYGINEEKKKILAIERYKNQELRKSILNNCVKKSNTPELAIKLEPYVYSWDNMDIPDDILDAFIKEENNIKKSFIQKLNEVGRKFEVMNENELRNEN